MKARSIVLALSLTSTVILAASPTRADPGAESPTSRVKAMFNTTIPPDIETWVQQRNGTVVLRNESLKLIAIHLPTSGANQMIADLMARGDVQVATYDAFLYAHHVRSPLVPNPPNDPRWGFEQYGPRLIQLGLAGDDGWDYEQGSDSLIIAVLDTGVDALHEDLFVPCRYLCSPAAYDVHGHGTHVAGIAAAQANNLKGIAGIAQVQLMAVKALNDTGVNYPSEAAVAVVQAVTGGARVLNMSFGGPCYHLGVYVCYDLARAIEIAHDEFGAVLVASTGNEFTSPGGCVGTGCVHYPASDSRVVAVGCITSTKGHCSYSRGGPEIDLVAPGDGILSTCSGAEIGCTQYAYRSGTSFSAPHVSGIAALILSHCPGTTNTQVGNLLRSTAEDLGAAGFDHYFGHGMVRAPQRTPSSMLGDQPGPSKTRHLARPIYWPVGLIGGKN